MMYNVSKKDNGMPQRRDRNSAGTNENIYEKRECFD